jgi:xanthosine utilization system XapX-like protein
MLRRLQLSPERRNSLILAFAAFVVVFLLWQWSGAATILYPFRLLVTFVHETGHGLAALVTGGNFLGFIVEPNGAGMTTTTGGAGWLILPMGYLGAAIFGAVLLAATNRVRKLEWVTTILGTYFVIIAIFFTRVGKLELLISIGAAFVLWTAAERWPERALLLRVLAVAAALFAVVTVFGNIALIVGLISGVVIAALGVYAPRPVTLFVLNAIAFIVGFNAVNDISSLWNNRTASLGTVRNDAYAMATLTHLPVELWIILWTLLAIAIMGVGAYYAFIRAREE